SNSGNLTEALALVESIRRDDLRMSSADEFAIDYRLALLYAKMRTPERALDFAMKSQSVIDPSISRDQNFVLDKLTIALLQSSEIYPTLLAHYQAKLNQPITERERTAAN